MKMLMRRFAGVACGLVASFAMGQNTVLPLPPNYKTIFANADFLVMKVHYGAHELVPMHDHTAYPTVYVYLNDSGVVEIKHEGLNGEVVKRPPTHTGAFRISPGIAERHSVQSISDTDSDFLRVELKSVPRDEVKLVFRGEAPARPLSPGTKVEFQNKALQVERTVCPATASCEMPAQSSASLLVAVSPTQILSGSQPALKTGDVLPLPADGASVRLSAGAHCLRVSVLDTAQP